MDKRSWRFLPKAGLVVAVWLALGGVACAQFPVMDAVAAAVISKYQNSTCEQLLQSRGTPPSAQAQEAIGFLQNNPEMRQMFFNQIASPVMEKMFECGMLP